MHFIVYPLIIEILKADRHYYLYTPPDYGQTDGRYHVHYLPTSTRLIIRSSHVAHLVVGTGTEVVWNPHYFHISHFNAACEYREMK